MTNKSKGRASKSKPEPKTTKKPASSKGDADWGVEPSCSTTNAPLVAPSHMPATDIRCSPHRIMGRTSRVLKWQHRFYDKNR
jgi:hypothetical protein